MTPSVAAERWPRICRALLLAGFAILVVARMPEIVLKGRFWAEEGHVFFANAWAMPPLQALFTPYGGYLNLVANAATVAAHLLLPLRLAPYMTIAVGLAFQLLPPLLLLTARDAWLARMRTRVAGVLLLLLLPGTEEIWLQSLHAQFELTLCCGIILALEPTAGRDALGRLAILALTPLCGPGGIVLVPLFLLRAARDRSGARLLQGLTLAAGSAIQLLLFVGPFAGRTYHLAPVMLLCVVAIRHVVEPLFGLKVAYLAGHAVRRELAVGTPVWALLLPVVVFVPLAVLSLRATRVAASRWLLAAAGATALAADYGAIGGTVVLIGAQSGERYVVVPQALLVLAILALAATASRRAVRAGASVAVLWLIVVGAGTYTATLRDVRNGPAWRDEMRLWQHDPSHALRSWPGGWAVTLTPRQPGLR